MLTPFKLYDSGITKFPFFIFIYLYAIESIFIHTYILPLSTKHEQRVYGLFSAVKNLVAEVKIVMTALICSDDK